MNVKRGLNIFYQISGFGLFILAVLGLISAADSRSHGTIHKVLVNIKPLEYVFY